MEQLRSVTHDGYIDLFGECLIKADAKQKDVIYIEASNQMQDSQGDTLLQKALDSQINTYLKRGVVSWDHMHKINNDPNYIIGEPLDVRLGSHTTLVKAKIYDTNKYGQGVLALAHAGSSRLGASVGGLITKRIKQQDDLTKAVKNYIVGVVWDETAITHKPVNEGTLGKVSIMPFEEFRKSFVADDTDLYKALMAGAGTDAATMTGGRAIQPESLMGAKKGLVKVIGHVAAGKLKTPEEFLKMCDDCGLANHKRTIMDLIIKHRESFPKYRTK